MAHDQIRIACISDTHDIYYPEIPEVDAIIHAGDITGSGSQLQTRNFLTWFESLPIKHKLFIGGNHDKFLERNGPAIVEEFPSVQMLWDSSYDLEGYKVWGSPYSPTFMNWYFMKDPEELEEHWKKIPKDVDIVVTHGPAYGTLDRAVPLRGHEHLGDKALAKTLSPQAPRYHICGHIHGSRGILTDWDGRTTAINAAVLDEAYRPWHQKTFVIELPRVAGEKDGDSIRNERL